jgi:hypothetical protein
VTPTTHPDETQLFAYVEGEPTAPDVAGHVRDCAVCADRVAELEAGRDALRAAPLLQLPDRRSRSIFEQLDRSAEERRARVRRLRDGDGWWAWSPKRLVAVLTPIAAILAVVTVFASTSGTGDDQAGERAAAGSTTAGAADQESALAAPAAVRSVAGTAGQVARFLQQQGLDAEAVDGRVEVRNAGPERVRQALVGIDDGAVPVVIAP